MVIISGILDNCFKTALGTPVLQSLENRVAQCVKIFKAVVVTQACSLAQIQPCHVED